MTQLLDEKQAAALLNVSVKALQAWRSRGGGPKFLKIGGRLVRYAMSDLESFVLDALRTSTSDRGTTPPSRPRIRIEHFLDKTRQPQTTPPPEAALPASRPKPR
jgi:predicted DNA-binding transcriptional regulator AlpA